MMRCLTAKENGISGGSSTPQIQLLFPGLVRSMSRKWLFSSPGITKRVLFWWFDT